MPTLALVAHETEGSKTVAVKIPADVREIISTMRQADPELDASSAIRKALRHWYKDSPQAAEPQELWALRALRRIKDRDLMLWASALEHLSLFAEYGGFKEAIPDHEEIANLAAQHRKRNKRGGAVRAPFRRKASEAR